MTALLTQPSHFELIQNADHEAVVYVSDKESGLRGFIALHNTVLGPGMGGVRIRQYPSEADALKDALALSEAMTYKNAVAGLDFGGGKSVIIADPHTEKTPEKLRAFAHRINLMQGRYVSASDMGSTAADLDIMREVSQWVPCKSKAQGGLGDSAPLTSLGVYQGIRAAVKVALDKDDLNGLTIGIEGVGKVGSGLAKYLLDAGCKVIASDIYPPALEAFKAKFPDAETTSIDELYTKPLDVFSPNGIGGTVTNTVVEQLQAKVIAGGANNPLESHATHVAIKNKGILFTPDFVVNAGGVITIAAEVEGRTWADAEAKTLEIYDTTLAILNEATQAGILPTEAAINRANERIRNAQ